MFDREAIEAAKAHAIAEFPREACGLVVAGRYVACTNGTADPERAFRIDAADYLAAGNRLEAVIHSHTAGQDWPTAADMRGQLDTAVPWGIVLTDGTAARDPFWFGDGVPTPPILGRRFRHGVTDCYSLIRDVFRLGRDGLAAQGIAGWPFEPIDLPEFPRDPEWWNSGENLYEDGFAKAGFARIDIAQARAGDVLLAQVQSPVINHGAVLLEGGIILHHLANRAGDRVSNREPVARWMRFVTHVLRYPGTNLST